MVMSEEGPERFPAPADPRRRGSGTASADGTPLSSGAEAILRPVRGGNAYEETVERLLAAVKLGLVGHGQRLPSEREMAAKLAVSRMTLREAIRSLREAGYVESRHGRLGGTFVTYRPSELSESRARKPRKVSREELTDVLSLRAAIELGAVAVAASRRPTKAEQAHLERCLEDASNAGAAAYRREDSRLHLALVEMTGSPSLVAAAADARMRLNDLLDEIPILDANLAHSNEQHARIVRAVLRRTPEAARRAMAEHLQGTAALLRGFLG
ncbi:MAG: GntR family transcriptional regulator [Actinomycetota bacterium]|nr:GntR family transcriptional regulator [Actinomycetota bacterium]